MYPDVLKLLMPSLRQGAIVLADGVTLFPDDVAAYLEFVRNPANGFVTVALLLGDGCGTSGTRASSLGLEEPKAGRKTRAVSPTQSAHGKP
jgi:hypothetical protein